MGKQAEIVRGVYERWGEGDFDTAAVFDPAAELVMPPELPDSGTYVGIERIADYMRGFLEPWTQLTMVAEAITEASEGIIVVDVLQQGVGSGSGAATELSYAHVWTFRGEKVVRLEAFREREAAARAAGLSG